MPEKPDIGADGRGLRYSIVLLAVLAALAVFITYLPSLQNGFVNWDDNEYVYENPMIRQMDLEFFKWVISSVVTNWHPLTMVSHAVDYRVWGLNPFGHHLTNTVLHSINTFLYFFLVYLLGEHMGFKGARSRQAEKAQHKQITAALVAAMLFGLHPLRVESVTWVAERKDVLCGFFYMLSLLTYILYARPPQSTTAPGIRKGLYYLPSLFFFVLAGLSKPMAVSLPAVLLILDFYPLKRLFASNDGTGRTKHILIEKAPFFLISSFLAVMTIWAQQAGEAIRTLETHTVSMRLFVSARAVVYYMYKMILPLDLSPYYPYPLKIGLLSIEFLSYLACLAVVTILCVLTLRRCRGLLAAWLFFIISLLPVIGLVQVGGQAMADRYTYIPGLAFYALVGTGFARAFFAISSKKTGWANGRWAVAAVAIIICALLAAKTARQQAVWRDSVSMWSEAIRLYPDSVPTAYNQRGAAYDELGEHMLALEDYGNAIRLNPSFSRPYVNRGIIYAKQGFFIPAIKDFDRALELNPMDENALLNRGTAFIGYGEYTRAADDLEKAVYISPGNAVAHYNLGIVYLNVGENTRAVRHFRKARALGLKEADEFLRSRGLSG